jgi:ribosomal protein S18 acetylase RimI-like enzyme
MYLDLRSLAETDRAGWLDLWTGYQRFYGVALSPVVTEATWRRIHDSGEPIHGLGAFRGQRIVGLTHFILHRSTWRVDDTCYLQDLYVDPAERRSGVARGLVAAVYAAADAAGAGQVYWLTHKTNAAGRGLYDQVAKNTGFIVYERFVDGQ